MKKQNKKLINSTILIFALVLLLSTTAYAKPFTDAFKGGLIQINDFFVNEQYKPYSATIDFVFFALLFISIYMMGARYAFKEVKKPEQVIVILLGLMTAFLLVLAGFSATIVLPYIQWLLYILLFILLWWLLKGIKNKFWRFVLALLLTLLIIGLFQGLFGFLTAPDAEGFFKSLGGSFSGIEFPGVGVPGVPSYLQDLLGAPSVTTPTETGPVSETGTPKAKAEEKGGIPWSNVLLPLVAVLALGSGVLGYRKGWFRRRAAPTEQPQQREQTVEEQIKEAIQKKGEAMGAIIAKTREKGGIIRGVDNQQVILNRLARTDVANLFSDESREQINQESGAFKMIMDKEIEFITELKKLKDLEIDLYKNKFNAWVTYFSSRGIQIQNEINELKALIDRHIPGEPLKNKGIVWLIVLCYDIEKRQIALETELARLLNEDNIEELVKGKFEVVKINQTKLSQYIRYEPRIIVHLRQKIEEQKVMLGKLRDKLPGGQGTQTQTTPQVTPPPAPPQTVAPAAQTQQAYSTVVAHEKWWFGRVRDYLTRRKSKLSPVARRDVEGIIREVEEAERGLEKIQKTGFGRRTLRRLRTISKGISDRAKAIAGWLRTKPNGGQAATILEGLEEQRASLEGELAQEEPPKETQTGVAAEERVDRWWGEALRRPSGEEEPSLVGPEETPEPDITIKIISPAEGTTLYIGQNTGKLEAEAEAETEDPQNIAAKINEEENYAFQWLLKQNGITPITIYMYRKSKDLPYEIPDEFREGNAQLKVHVFSLSREGRSNKIIESKTISVNLKKKNWWHNTSL